MSQSWSFDFSPYIHEIDYVYAYLDLDRVLRIERQGRWAIKVNKIVLNCGYWHWVSPANRRGMKLETWTFVKGVVQPINISDATMEDTVRWQLDFGSR